MLGITPIVIFILLFAWIETNDNDEELLVECIEMARLLDSSK